MVPQFSERMVVVVVYRNFIVSLGAVPEVRTVKLIESLLGTSIKEKEEGKAEFTMVLLPLSSDTVREAGLFSVSKPPEIE